MKHSIKYPVVLLFILWLAGEALSAQPPARKRAKAEEKKETAVSLTERAKAQYPTAAAPEEVVWKRDIYRTLDLTKEKNAPLYYPVAPQAGSINLFTCIFRLLSAGQISAYEYGLDGYEQFTPEKQIKLKDMLENYHVYYEEKEGKITIQDSDIPNNEILSYYIKESYYFDQKTSTYNQQVVAICPVLHRSGDFGVEVTKYPMFWLNYAEISPYLAQTPVMTSSYNNIQSTSLDDFFAKHQYQGDIYKTVNLRNLALSQYCSTDSALKKEQANIEKQLADFEERLWKGATSPTELKNDSAALAKGEGKAISKREKKQKEKKKENTVKESNSSSSSGSSSPRVSVRRQRR